MTGHARGTAAYRRLSLALLLAGFATFSLLYSVQPLLPVFAHQYRLSAETASLAVSLTTGPLALTILVASIVSDRAGRRPVMLASLFSAALLTIATAFVPGWSALLAMRLLTGIALAGIPAVAMAYLAEEVHEASVGAAMGLYIAGSAIGGMIGRLGVGLLTGAFGWRWAMGGIGVAGLAAAIGFWVLLPRSQRFVVRRQTLRSLGTSLMQLTRDPALPWLYAATFMLMGVFVTVYNYAGFRLMAPPYALGSGGVGLIFLLYIVGSFASAWVGGLAGRLGRRRVFWMPVAVLLAGVAITAASPLPLIVLGIGVVTAGFFGAHSVASAWVSRRAGADRALGSALYLFFYYMGSSILGSAGGIAWSRAGWHGVAVFCAGLTLLTLAIARHLVRVPPLTADAAVIDSGARAAAQG